MTLKDPFHCKAKSVMCVKSFFSNCYLGQPNFSVSKNNDQSVHNNLLYLLSSSRLEEIMIVLGYRHCGNYQSLLTGCNRALRRWRLKRYVGQIPMHSSFVGFLFLLDRTANCQTVSLHYIQYYLSWQIPTVSKLQPAYRLMGPQIMIWVLVEDVCKCRGFVLNLNQAPSTKNDKMVDLVVKYVLLGP